MTGTFQAHAIRDRYNRVSRDGLLAALNALAEAPALDATAFSAVEAPVLVCASQEHESLSDLRSFARELDAARLLTFRECESSAVHGRPVDFADQVFRFLRAVEEGETVSGERTI